jgi:hypothetical protein
VVAEAEVRLKFDGPAVAGGQMNARSVGRSLTAISDLVTHLQSADPDLRNASPPDVRVTSFEPGSFDIHLLLEALGEVWEQLRALGSGPDVTAVVQLSAVIGFVIGYIKRFGRRRVASHSTDESGDQVEVMFEDGEPSRAVMSAETFVAFMSPQVRRATRRLVEPIEQQGVESLTVTTAPGNEVVVTKKDAPNFHVEEPTPPDSSTTRRTARVQPVSVDFRRESWKVSEGATSFPVSVEDEMFLSRLDEGDATIGKTDTFEVSLRTEQYSDPDGRLKVKHAIERIIDHQRGSIQERLDFDHADEA